ncbi:ubiquinol-cytochrome c reductase core subunit 2 [Paragonimus westermani]|uniref:Ubiquinol-cytochrome c reductase core subunit 2 n=1 Tax=Paragonimus westermani TaxID=34504 RepID=A0A5J4NL68_9TREM|nr:ubiquinol-cytochrome c reductase core subunit 2 [Paragonimus westermani]
MFQGCKLYGAVQHARTAVTATAVKQASALSPVFGTSEEGYRLASLAQPSVWPGLSRVAIVFKAGSRYELSGKDRGITHLIRRSCGLSTTDFTAVNMVRHFQQMGARVTCTTTREHMIYTVDVAPNFATRAGYLLARMATGTSYYEWELKSTAYKLMHKDIDLLNRRNLPALAMELLHQAAFGESSAGTGLGHSVFAPADRVGSHSFEQIESFHKHFFVPTNCTVSLVGHDPEADGLELLREIKAGLHVRAPQKVPEKTGKVHGFVGGDIRRDLAAASSVTACIAWPTPGTGSQQLPYDVASCLLSGSVGRISYGGCSSLTHLDGQSGDDEYTQPVAFHKTYDGHGLLGVSVRGPTAKVVGDRLAQIVTSLKTVKISAEELARAKSICKANICMSTESVEFLATDLALRASGPETTYESSQQQVAAVDKVTVAQVNDAIKQAVSTPHCALAVVGPEANEILPLNVLI